MKLSVIVISYDMAREVPRCLQSLARNYQLGATELDYEVILVDNGSPQPLEANSWSGIDTPVQLIYFENAPPSIVPAINRALAVAKGDIVCLMVDGAHVLTPGVFQWALGAYAVFDNPVVAVRYFWLGPQAQNHAVTIGYTQAVEDQNLAAIDWPNDGYRLFEIGTPLRVYGGSINWFQRMFESNCLFLKRSHFEAIGGADERFDLVGGGIINTDIFKQAIDAPGVDAVQLIGEGSFHQIHGGLTTNVSQEARDATLESYFQQYEQIRGDRDIVTSNALKFMGHLPNEASMIHRAKLQRD